MKIHLLSLALVGLITLLLGSSGLSGQHLIPDQTVTTPDYISVKSELAKSNLPAVSEEVLSTMQSYVVDIVFAANDGLYVQFNDRIERVKIYARPSNYTIFRRPIWSSDGTKIAVTAVRNLQRTDILILDLILGTVEIAYIMNVAGTNFFSGEVYQVSWSSDDTYLSISSIALDVSFSSALTSILNLNTGQVEVSLPFYTSAQFDPTPGSYKLAFVNLDLTVARPGIGINDLSLNNGEIIWAYATDFSVWSQVAWRDQNRLYSVVNDSQLVLFEQRNGNNIQTYTAANAGPGGALSICSVNSNGSRFYISELINNFSTLYHCNLSTRGLCTTFSSMGYGWEPDWSGSSITVTDTEIPVFESNLSFSIYPNPVSSFLNLELENPDQEDIRVVLLNGKGRILLTKKLMRATLIKEKLEVDQLPPGSYFLNVSDGKRTVTKPWIKS